MGTVVLSLAARIQSMSALSILLVVYIYIRYTGELFGSYKGSQRTGEKKDGLLLQSHCMVVSRWFVSSI